MPTLPMHLWPDRIRMGALVGVTAWLTLKLANGPGELAVIWIGNGIFTGWLLARPTSVWPPYIIVGALADVSARLLSADLAFHAALIGLSNLIEVVAAAVIVRHFVPDVWAPKDWLGLGGIATGSTVVACAISGAIAAASTAAIYRTSFESYFTSWFAAHVVGMFIIATTTLVVHREGLGALAVSERRWRFVGCMALVAVVAGAVFMSPYPLLFLTYPPLLLGAVRHRFAGVATGVILLTIIGSVAATTGHGPLWLVPELGLEGRIALLQIYIAGGCLMAFPVVLAMAERDRLNDRVRESEHRYRMLADYSHDLVVRMRASGERLYVSPSAREMLDWNPSEMLGSQLTLVHPEDVDRHRHAAQDVLASGQSQTLRYRVKHKEGHYVWIEVVMRPIPSEQRAGETDLMLVARNISRRVEVEEALEESRRELERLVRVDTLTGVANRRQLDERLPLALMRLQRSGIPLALLYIDVDHFKQINDVHGHATGDHVLCVFAQRLLASVRASDLVARIGGDEFVILIEDAALPITAQTIAEKLIAQMRDPIVIESCALTVSTSIGVGLADAPTKTANLMSAADAALYEAKKAGRNTYSLKAVCDRYASVS